MNNLDYISYEDEDLVDVQKHLNKVYKNCGDPGVVDSNMNLITKYKEASISYLRKHLSELDVRFILHKTLPIDFLEKLIESHNISEEEWKLISIHQKIDEPFMRKYKSKLYWQFIAEFHPLSENFIEEFSNVLNWMDISKYQNLSEDFIEKHEDLVYWEYICKYQTLSPKFIKKFINKIDKYNLWRIIDKYQKLGDNIILEYFDYFNIEDLLLYQEIISKDLKNSIIVVYNAKDSH